MKRGKNILQVFIFREKSPKIPLYEIISPNHDWTIQNVFIRYWKKIPFGDVKLYFQANHKFGFDSIIAIDNIILNNLSCNINSK